MDERMTNKYRSPIDRETLLVKLRQLEGDWHAFERRLRAEERKIWQPHWSHSDALAERLSRVGYPLEAIDLLKKHLEIINQLLRGEPLAADIQAKLEQRDVAQRAAAESAVKQLAAIVVAAPTGRLPQQRRQGVEVSTIPNLPKSLGFIRFVG